jgi:Ankyrin repeat
MPTRRLPPEPSLRHLKLQAKDLLRAQRSRALGAAQRIREFHARYRRASDAEIGDAAFGLSDALLTIAREYGFTSWPRLRAHIEGADRADLSLPKHERIRDAEFRQAVDLLDAGDAEGLRTYLAEHPDIVGRRVTLEGDNYFTQPALLEFVAENPTRRGRLSANVAEMTKTILDAGGGVDQAVLDSALGLVSSSDVAQRCGASAALIDVLCDRGADPNAAMLPALLYGVFDSVAALERRGAAIGAAAAAATGRVERLRALLATSGDEELQWALALAAQHGHLEAVAALLDAGVDPNRYSPVGGHSHATPLHQAALAGWEPIARLLVERGARLDLPDLHHDATPAQWAEYAGHPELARYLTVR